MQLEILRTALTSFYYLGVWTRPFFAMHFHPWTSWNFLTFLWLTYPHILDLSFRSLHATSLFVGLCLCDHPCNLVISLGHTFFFPILASIFWSFHGFRNWNLFILSFIYQSPFVTCKKEKPFDLLQVISLLSILPSSSLRRVDEGTLFDALNHAAYSISCPSFSGSHLAVCLSC